MTIPTSKELNWILDKLSGDTEPCLYKDYRAWEPNHAFAKVNYSPVKPIVLQSVTSVVPPSFRSPSDRSPSGPGQRRQVLRPISRAATGRGRSVSCSAGENALPRINRLQIRAVIPDDEKIMEMVTNW